MDKYGSQYKGGSQHDAQEFLLWLLDKVHEELNMATKKKYKQIRNTPGRPDDVLAAEALANYARCNNSFVVDIFQAGCCCRPGNSFTYLSYRYQKNLLIRKYVIGRDFAVQKPIFCVPETFRQGLIFDLALFILIYSKYKVL